MNRHASWLAAVGVRPARQLAVAVTGPQRMFMALGLIGLLAAGVSAGGALAARGATQVAPAAGVLLVARRDLPDWNFHRTVVFLTAHGAGGTVGVVVNRRTRLRLADAVPDLPGVEKTAHPLFFGGPVAATQVVMLMRNEKAREGVERVVDGIYLSADRDVLAALIARNKPARDLRLYAGHAGWAPGQLQHELARRDWYVVEADAESLFGDDVDTLWERLIDKLDPAARLVREPTGVATARAYLGIPWRGWPGRAATGPPGGAASAAGVGRLAAARCPDRLAVEAAGVKLLGAMIGVGGDVLERTVALTGDGGATVVEHVAVPRPARPALGRAHFFHARKLVRQRADGTAARGGRVVTRYRWHDCFLS